MITARSKTEECLWCGRSEADGAELTSYLFGGRLPRHACTDKDACTERIRMRVAGLRP